MGRVLADVLNSRCWHHQAQAAAHYLRVAVSLRLALEAPRLVVQALRLVVAVAHQRTGVVAPQPAAPLWLGDGGSSTSDGSSGTGDGDGGWGTGAGGTVRSFEPMSQRDPTASEGQISVAGPPGTGWPVAGSMMSGNGAQE